MGVRSEVARRRRRAHKPGRRRRGHRTAFAPAGFSVGQTGEHKTHRDHTRFKGSRFYVGRYEAKGEGIFTIARENDFLTIESPADWGLPKLRIRPESQQDFSPPTSGPSHVSNRSRRQSPQPDNLSSERPKRRASKQTRCGKRTKPHQEPLPDR